MDERMQFVSRRLAGEPMRKRSRVPKNTTPLLCLRDFLENVACPPQHSMRFRVGNQTRVMAQRTTQTSR